MDIDILLALQEFRNGSGAFLIRKKNKKSTSIYRNNYL